ncbi:MAG: RHS repeat-associated core domain-containing protein [Phycisphaerae bacterium]
MAGNYPNETTDYLWQGWQTVEERNPFGGSGSTDTAIRQYVWGTYIDECIELTTFVALGSQNLEPGSYYLLQDLLFRAVALTNSTGAIVEAYDTDAYGNTLISTGPGADGVWFTNDDVQSSYGANDIIYCGYRFDPETELYYVRNRTYSPTLGRWLQRDPIGYAGGINLYEYVGGGAVATVDPTGTSGCGQLLDQINELRQEELKKIAEAGRIASELQRRPQPPWYERLYLKLEFTADIAEATALHNRANLLEDIYRSTCKSKVPPVCPVPDTTPGLEPGGAPGEIPPPVWEWIPPEIDVG